jgi:hypothetical protein
MKMVERIGISMFGCNAVVRVRVVVRVPVRVIMLNSGSARNAAKLIGIELLFLIGFGGFDVGAEVNMFDDVERSLGPVGRSERRSTGRGRRQSGT